MLYDVLMATRSNMEEYLYLFDVKSEKWICSNDGDQFENLTTELIEEEG